MTTAVANAVGEEGPKKDVFSETSAPGDGFGQQNQEISIEQTPVVSESQIERKAEERVAQQKLNEAMEKYQVGTFDAIKKQLQEKGDDLKEQNKRVDQLSLKILYPKDVKKLSESQQKEHEENFRAVTQIYDTVNAVTFGFVNPYAITLGMRVGKMKKVRSALEKRIEDCESALKGTAVKKGHSEFCSKLLEYMPDKVKKDTKYSNVMKFLEETSGNTTAAKGLEAQQGELKEEGRFLLDVKDLCEASIAEYKTKLDSTSKEIADLNKRIFQKPDTRPMNDRSLKMALFNEYQKEQDNYVRKHEEIVDRLLNLNADLDLVEYQINLRDTTLRQSKQRLRAINSTVKQLEYFVKNGNNVVVRDHIALIKNADDLVVPAVAIAEINGYTAAVQMQELMKNDDSSGAGLLGAKSGAEFRQLSNGMKAKEHEVIDALTAKLRNRFY